MPVYEYTALDAAGKRRKGMVDAEDPRQARQRVRAQGLYVDSLREAKAGSAPADAKPAFSGLGGLKGADVGTWFRQRFTRVSATQLTASTRQLATLLTAGLPLEQCLGAILEQSKGTALYTVMARIRERVRQGDSLAVALREHPSVFSPTYATMVEAGESSGALELVMARLADFAEQELALRRKVVSALTYPIVMLVVGLAVVFFLMGYVVPKITQIFDDMQQALPLPTEILIFASDVVRGYWFLFPVALVGIWAGFTFMARTPSGKRRLDAIKLKLPVVGALGRAVSVARFSRTLATLGANGVPLLTSLAIVANVVDNVLVREAADAVRAEVSEGRSFAGALAEFDVFPAILTQMVAAGEQSGDLDAMLFRAAEMYEDEIEAKLAVMASLIEPAMLLLMGGIMGFVVLAVLLPIFEMSTLVK